MIVEGKQFCSQFWWIPPCNCEEFLAYKLSTEKQSQVQKYPLHEHHGSFCILIARLLELSSFQSEFLWTYGSSCIIIFWCPGTINRFCSSLLQTFQLSVFSHFSIQLDVETSALPDYLDYHYQPLSLKYWRRNPVLPLSLCPTFWLGSRTHHSRW